MTDQEPTTEGTDELVECDTIDGGVRLVPRAQLRPRPTAYGAVTDDEGRLLTLRLEETGRLVLPGGGIEPGESAQEAVEREVLEETGVEVRAQAVIGWTEANYYDERSGEAWAAQVKLLACDVLRRGPVPQPAPEGEPVWIALEALTRSSFQGPSARLMGRYLDRLQGLPRGPGVPTDDVTSGGAMDATYQLRDAGEDDIEYVHAVRTEALCDHVTATFGVWDDEEQRERLQAGWARYRYRIVQVGGEDVGVLCVDPDADPLRLLVVALEARVRGRGVGTAVVRDVVEEASTAGKSVQLRVMRSNPDARRLYERLGFTVTGETATHHLMSTV